MSVRPVSEVYPLGNEPLPDNHTLVDVPLSSDEVYEGFGYSVGYERDAHGNAVPEDGNTAIFCIPPGGRTEPVYVTKSEPGATISVKVLAGTGRFIRALAWGEGVDQVPLREGTEVVIRPHEAYAYQNLGEDDLILHDVARPAFLEGDEEKLHVSSIRFDRKGLQKHLRDSYSYKTRVLPDGKVDTFCLKTEFFDRLVSEA